MPKRRCAFKGCKKYHEEGVSNGVNSWCSLECIEKHAFDQITKVRKSKEKEEKASKRESNKLKRAYYANNLPTQIDLTRKAFNTMIRFLDRGKRCPTCDVLLILGEYDAGHVRTVASCPQLRFDARNCFGQCRKCNGSGTIRKRTRKTQEVVSDLYREWIRENMGDAYYEWLYGPHPSPKWSCDDLRNMRAVFAEEIRILEKTGIPTRDWRAL